MSSNRKTRAAQMVRIPRVATLKTFVMTLLVFLATARWYRKDPNTESATKDVAPYAEPVLSTKAVASTSGVDSVATVFDTVTGPTPWKDSSIYATKVQSYEDAPCLYQGNCSGRGENLLGRCFCFPGFVGVRCEREDSTRPIHCTNTDDRCFYSEESGVWIVSLDRWHFAQAAEHAAWRESQMPAESGDRVEEHMLDFDEYAAVGAAGTNLGLFVEVGAGPWTQSLWMMKRRNFTVDKYILLEPGALEYSKGTESCVYKTGQLPGFDGKTVIINAGGEHLDLLQGSVDTLLLINVLEHVQNAISILRNVYRALKPGGLLIFNDRWWDMLGAPGEQMDLDTTYHPVRIKQVVFDQFLSGFEKMYERRNEEVKSFSMYGRSLAGTYFIGRKKELCK